MTKKKIVGPKKYNLIQPKKKNSFCCVSKFSQYKIFFFFLVAHFYGFHYYFFGQKVKTLNLIQVPRYGFSQKAKYESQTLSFIPGSQQHTLFLNPKSQQLLCMAQSKISNLRFWNDKWRTILSLSLSLSLSMSIKETIEFWTFRLMAQLKDL